MNLKTLLLLAKYSTWIPSIIQFITTAEKAFAAEKSGPRKKNFVVNTAIALIEDAGTAAESMDTADAAEIGLIVDALVAVANEFVTKDTPSLPPPAIDDPTTARYASFESAKNATSIYYPYVLYYTREGQYGVWNQSQLPPAAVIVTAPFGTVTNPITGVETAQTNPTTPPTPLPFGVAAKPANE